MLVVSVAPKFRALFGFREFRRSPVRVVMRMAAWEFYRVRGKPVTLSLGPFAVRVRRGDGIGRLICYFGEAADEMLPFLQTYLKPRMTVIDVGANVGTHTLYAAHAVAPGGQVYAFEPEPGTRDLLETNLLQNGIRNAIVRSECVSDQPGRVVLNVNADSAKTSLIRMGDSQIEVDADSLDNLLPDLQIDLLKIDVEGADLQVLLGARQIFAERPPKLVIIEATVNQEAIADFLRSRGYKLCEYNADSGSLEALHSNSLNWYAVHSSLLPQALGTGWLSETASSN